MRHCRHENCLRLRMRYGSYFSRCVLIYTVCMVLSIAPSYTVTVPSFQQHSPQVAQIGTFTLYEAVYYTWLCERTISQPWAEISFGIPQAWPNSWMVINTYFTSGNRGDKMRVPRRFKSSIYWTEHLIMVVGQRCVIAVLARRLSRRKGRGGCS